MSRGVHCGLSTLPLAHLTANTRFRVEGHPPSSTDSTTTERMVRPTYAAVAARYWSRNASSSKASSLKSSETNKVVYSTGKSVMARSGDECIAEEWLGGGWVVEVVGETEGTVVGAADGEEDGAAEVGAEVGLKVGAEEVGLDVGCLVVGGKVGQGWRVGVTVGVPVVVVGETEGTVVGAADVATADGEEDSAAEVGGNVGQGWRVGENVGQSVPSAVPPTE